MDSITPEQALAILDQATQPQNQGKHSRQDYINIHVALQTIEAAIRKVPKEKK